jgi:hypothetical protein
MGIRSLPVWAVTGRLSGTYQAPLLHVLPYGETACGENREAKRFDVDGRARTRVSTSYEDGLLTGILIGEGHFGGDGRQPQVTLRMHVRHRQLFEWIVNHYGGRLYGPYSHGGRNYYQWMARGPFLRSRLVPLLDERLSAEVDAYAWRRFTDMKIRYRL